RYAELLSAAVGVPYPTSDYLEDVDGGFYCTCYLRAWAFEAQLRAHLRERFGGAWFASAAAGGLLRELWTLGQAKRADTLLADVVLFGVYNRFWRYVSTRDMWVLVRAVVVSTFIADLTVYIAEPVAHIRLPRSVAIMDLLLLLAFVTGSRLVARSFSERPAM